MQKLILLICCTYYSIALFSQTHYDLIITNGRIIDGSGSAWYKADVAVKDGRIVKIGQLTNDTADEMIDAKQRIVCPGFIDVHGHIEGSIGIRPTADNLLFDGVTSMITGNCGRSKPLLGMFFKELDSIGISMNVGSLIGHNTVRSTVMGEEDRAPTAEELENMKKMVDRGMKEGAVGLSTGLIYMPGAFAETDEIVALAKIIQPYGGVYTSHIRQEDDRVYKAISEAVEIGRQAKVPVEISHIKIKGKSSWGGTDKIINMIEGFREEGIDVTADQYPYTASSTSLSVTVPDWAQSGGRDSLIIRMNDPLEREKIIEGAKQKLARFGYSDFTYAVVANCPWNASYNGKNISEVNRMKGRGEGLDNEVATILEMLEKGKRVQMVYHAMSEDDVKSLMKYENTMIASDGGIPSFNIGSPHPRSYGTNARVIHRYVNELGLFTLEEAIRKMTSFPARKYQLIDRGFILPGFAADILILDPERIKDMATFEKPHAYSEGIDIVVVNGEIVIKDKKHTGVRSGKILRRGQLN
ncbi:MAG: D-aminoacylase [Bacteroidota bacterium]